MKDKNNKGKSKFVKAGVGTVAITVVASGCFVFALFQTNAVMDIPDATQRYFNSFNNISVSTVIKEAEDDPSGPSGPQGTPNSVMPGTPPPGSKVTLGGDAQIVKDKLSQSAYASKAEALALAYQVCIDNGFDDNAAVGLMACLWNEGSFSVVEHYFSKSGAGGFKLPSGGVTAKDKTDVDYLRAWPSSSSDKTTVNITNSKGKTIPVTKTSCGFGMIQWSFERRITLCDEYLNAFNSCGTTTVDDNVSMLAETSMMSTELKPGSSYHTDVCAKLGSKDPSVENWCEAFCDAYIKPSKYCGGKMAGSGTCAKYRQTATELATVLQ